ncbi:MULTISPECIES: hypothetical protein [unclassified Streptomyces]|uniref:hypothetical protein n=1 Tax=unclassified Streptomyces TaxID=2593676 RepID=UPI000DBA5A06|nr:MULTISPECIES: hypothetical protein [unclassified Streptomyces]MYT75964.1 hypothetical protein [Streptomyces sp. SID8367]RAJ77797.1 hypothetical protein K377_05721 [Streptomyces sp. PsTaAH-137]
MVGVMCTGLAAGLAACGNDPDEGTNGVGKLEPDTIQSRTVKAARGADAVHLAGTVVSGGKTYKLDMRLKDEGGTGSVTTGGSTFRLLRVDEHLYLKADADFWSHSDDDTVGDKLDGKYVKVPSGDPSYQRLSTFTDKDVLLDGLLTLHGTLAKGDRGTSGGVRTIALTGDEGSGGTLDVSLEGTAYPMRLERAGGAGILQLTEWGQDFKLSEPTSDDTVDYGRQLPES